LWTAIILERTEGKKQGPYILGFTAHSVKILNEGLLRGEIRQPGTVTVSYDEKPGMEAMAQ
jgi:hypothetical protein